jgi:hypothetical protein
MLYKKVFNSFMRMTISKFKEKRKNKSLKYESNLPVHVYTLPLPIALKGIFNFTLFYQLNIYIHIDFQVTFTEYTN